MTIPKASPQRPEDENLGVAANMAYGLQHVLTMYGGIEIVMVRGSLFLLW